MPLAEYEHKDGDLLKEYGCEGSISSRFVGVVIGDVMGDYSTFEIPTQNLFDAYSDLAKEKYIKHEDMNDFIDELDKIGKMVEAKKAELIAMRDEGNYPHVRPLNTQEEPLFDLTDPDVIMRGVDIGLAPIIEENLNGSNNSLDGLAQEIVEGFIEMTKDQREDFRKLAPLCVAVMEKSIS